MRRPLFFLTALLIGSASLAAEESVLYATVGNWSVFSDQTTKGACFTTATFADGTTIRLGFWHRGYKYPAYVSFSNAKWKSIQPRKEYQVAMQLDSSPPWKGVGTGWVFGPEKAILVNIDNPNLFREFVEKNQISFIFKQRPIASLSLAGSSKALVEMLNCQAVNVEHRRPKQEPDQSDPFATPDASTKSDDPFEL